MNNGQLQTFGGAVTVTKSDTAPNNYAAFMVGVTGDVAIQNVAGTTIVLAAVPAYTVIPIATVRIMSASTTATQIIGLT